MSLRDASVPLLCMILSFVWLHLLAMMHKQADRCICCIRRRERGGAYRKQRVVGVFSTDAFALLFYLCSYVEKPSSRKVVAWTSYYLCLIVYDGV